MLATIQSFINSAINPKPVADQDKAVGLQLAAAALMVEVAVADFQHSPEEREMLVDALEFIFKFTG